MKNKPLAIYFDLNKYSNTMNTQQIIKEEVASLSNQILETTDILDIENNPRIKAIFDEKNKIVEVLNSLDDFFAQMTDPIDIGFVEGILGKISKQLFLVTSNIQVG